MLVVLGAMEATVAKKCGQHDKVNAIAIHLQLQQSNLSHCHQISIPIVSQFRRGPIEPSHQNLSS